jgi:hypothetical protein
MESRAKTKDPGKAAAEAVQIKTGNISDTDDRFPP